MTFSVHDPFGSYQGTATFLRVWSAGLKYMLVKKISDNQDIWCRAKRGTKSHGEEKLVHVSHGKLNYVILSVFLQFFCVTYH